MVIATQTQIDVRSNGDFPEDDEECLVQLTTVATGKDTCYNVGSVDSRVEVKGESTQDQQTKRLASFLASSSAVVPYSSFYASDQSVRKMIPKVVKIQAAWRGIAVRNRLIKPQSIEMGIESKVFVQSNEPQIDSFSFIDTRSSYIYLCCGGVSILEHLMQWMHTGKLPLVFIVDHNSKVKLFWECLKGLFYCSNSIEQVVKALKSTGQQALYKPIPAAEQCEKVGLQQQFYNFKSLPLFLWKITDKGDDSKFQFLRTIVLERVQFILQAWENSRTFRFIHELARIGNRRVCVFTSNIPECMISFPQRVSLIRENIRLLSPDLEIETDNARYTGYPSMVYIREKGKPNRWINTSKRFYSERQLKNRQQNFTAFFNF
ncbi:hypothetical protein [Parashewanella tropica]|uniref:hypothetical protein n=1 Tax=Parashewanella tropica TaxID=2547970 RepID=UPI0010597645|nr:hypothetical protein [Parashewanella tropica]